MQLTRRVPKNIVNAARNFAITIETRLTGEVSRSCSVPLFFSSEKERIVRRGMMTIYAYIRNWKYEDTSAVCIWSVQKAKRKPEAQRKIAAKIYPVGVVK